ncbi:hypothetical protein PsYK624_088150 [Phanerochaete sordida]|uniref:Uncharacterized protein n=1 Tax=Phanerochaete sordida TaxID=48140 RepID=A0A9P3GDC6_9APHY|nr:hypothetical protein PsYK624_088150 [Phanerochaete sordida]
MGHAYDHLGNHPSSLGTFRGQTLLCRAQRVSACSCARAHERLSRVLCWYDNSAHAKERKSFDALSRGGQRTADASLYDLGVWMSCCTPGFVQFDFLDRAEFLSRRPNYLLEPHRISQVGRGFPLLVDACV